MSDSAPGPYGSLTPDEQEALAKLDLEEMRVMIRRLATAARSNEWMAQVLKIAVIGKGLDEMVSEKAMPVVLAVAIEMIAESEMPL